MSNEPAQFAAAAPVPEIPGYQLGEILGRGATGTVYRALQLAVDREVAIKVLHPELAGSKAVRRLQREARTTARLAHPGIVSAIDMGQVGGLWWYAMELVDGPSLSALLREKGRLSEREALRLFIPLCEALEHAHEQGVVHRDIKPANILVDAHGRARLVDLGLAFTEDDPLLTRTGGTLGTPHYLSPEQARNPQAVDGRSDIWSLGATMFHALCGRPPFTGDSVAEILSGVLYAHIPDPRELEPGLSPGMGLVLRKCLTRNTDKRYGKPSELLRDLEALRERRAVHVSARSLDPVAGAAERRRRKLWISVGVAAVIACSGLIWWRPWTASLSTGETRSEVRVPWEQLERILDDATADDPRAPGLALARLDELKDGDSIRPEYSKDYWDARGSVETRFKARINAEHNRVLKEYERALAERDFVRAAALISDEEDQRVARELGANERQRKAVHEKLDFGDMRVQLANEEGIAMERFLQRVSAHYEEVIVPETRRARTAGAWRDALALMKRDVRETLESARISSKGLSAGKVAENLAKVRLLTVDREVHVIEKAWQDLDRELEAVVLARQEAIAAALKGRALGEDAAAAIDAAYAEELAKRSLRPEQMLTSLSDRSHQALDRARDELNKLQEEFLVKDANAELDAVDRQLVTAWKDRRYSEIAAEWDKRMDEEWLRSVHAEVELRLGEAKLLEGLLARAVQGLAKPGLDSILVGTIPRTGQIQFGADPLRDGFQLVIRGKPEFYALRAPLSEGGARLLGLEGIERLAGFASDPKDEANTLDRLVRALFRLREGDTEGALRVFNSGPLPFDSHGTLIADLEARLSKARGALTAKIQQREDDAESAYNLIQREATVTSKRDAQDRIKHITDILTQFGDTAFVREHEAALRDLRAQLSASKPTPEARLKEVYGSMVSFPVSGRALIDFTCTTESNPHWVMGDWKRGLDGWSADRDHARLELENDTKWPRTLLSQSLDLDSEMKIQIEFEQPQGSGDPKKLVISVAGWHIGFVGPNENGGKSLVATTAGDASALRELLRLLDSRKGEPSPGPERGKSYILRVNLSQGRGKLSAWLGDEPIKVRDQIRPEGKGGSDSIVVRSMEPVLLKAVRIDAGLAKK